MSRHSHGHQDFPPRPAERTALKAENWRELILLAHVDRARALRESARGRYLYPTVAGIHVAARSHAASDSAAEATRARSSGSTNSGSRSASSGLPLTATK